MTISIGLLGTGRLGAAIRDAASDRSDLRVAWAVGRDAVPATPVDVAIDVSSGDAVPAHLAWARRTGTPLVVGTTGWDPVLLGDDVSVPVLVAPNFSLGVALARRLARVLGGYAASAPVDVDLAVTESHHRHKADAPSGTAIALREALAEGAGRSLDTVQTTSLRMGSVVGEHEVVVASGLETITLRHVAHDRRLFAVGALTAALWLSTRTPGHYTVDDLAEDSLRTLLGPPPPSAAPAADSAA